jgi:hypothetical protein
LWVTIKHKCEQNAISEFQAPFQEVRSRRRKTRAEKVCILSEIAFAARVN